MPTISYQLKRTRRRRSIALTIDSAGTVTVLAPRFALKYFIERFVQEKADWIREKLKVFEQTRLKYPVREFVNGERFPVWGQEALLYIETHPSINRSSCEWTDGQLRLSLREGDDPLNKTLLTSLLRDWFTSQTETRLAGCLPEWAKRIGVTPGKVKVTNQKRRWGSCSREGNLRFNWRLSMMPSSILDYVAVHELAHIKAHDHSKRFWSIVQAVLPDYKERRKWLRQNGAHLNI